MGDDVDLASLQLGDDIDWSKLFDEDPLDEPYKEAILGQLECPCNQWKDQRIKFKDCHGLFSDKYCTAICGCGSNKEFSICSETFFCEGAKTLSLERPIAHQLCGCMSLDRFKN